MAVKLTKPEMINQQVGWCGGCGHGIIQRLIAECCEELGIVEKTVQVVDIACAYWSIDTLNCDGIAGPHTPRGPPRPPASPAPCRTAQRPRRFWQNPG